MQFNITSISMFVLALATTSYGAPTPNPVDTSAISGLETRMATAKPRVLVDCQGQTFTPDAITAAMNQAKTGQNIGGSKFPAYYGNSGGIFSATGTLYEFPIMASGDVYTGGNPSKYRVVMDEGYRYQGTMVHVGGIANNFAICG